MFYFLISMLKYTSRILKHKYYVLKYRHLTNCSLRLALTHDLSKFRPSEFFPYLRYFFLGRTEVHKLRFENAFKLHYLRNKHHWEHWDGQPMPRKYIREMVTDWISAGIVYSGKVPIFGHWDWWLANKDKIVLHPDTKASLYGLLRYLVIEQDYRMHCRGAKW